MLEGREDDAAGLDDVGADVGAGGGLLVESSWRGVLTEVLEVVWELDVVGLGVGVGSGVVEVFVVAAVDRELVVVGGIGVVGPSSGSARGVEIVCDEETEVAVVDVVSRVGDDVDGGEEDTGGKLVWVSVSFKKYPATHEVDEDDLEVEPDDWAGAGVGSAVGFSAGALEEDDLDVVGSGSGAARGGAGGLMAPARLRNCPSSSWAAFTSPANKIAATRATARRRCIAPGGKHARLPRHRARMHFYAAGRRVRGDPT